MSEKGSLLYHHADDNVSLDTLAFEIHHSPERATSWTRSPRHIFILYVVNALTFTALWLCFHGRATTQDPALQLYSPANTAVEYELSTLVGGFAPQPGKTGYFGAPNNETDALWESLYQVGVSVITEKENSKLHQPSVSVRGHPDQYVVILGVFHKLHCLNRLRHSLYPEVYGSVILPDGSKNAVKFHHLEHCVDLLRQSLMCQSDTSVGFFRRTEDGALEPQANVTRVCRKFDKVREWAVERHARNSVS